jgi:hypothetical protein
VSHGGHEGTATSGVARTSRSEDLVYLGFTFWTTVGLCLDGWAHRHQPGADKTYLGPLVTLGLREPTPVEKYLCRGFFDIGKRPLQLYRRRGLAVLPGDDRL